MSVLYPWLDSRNYPIRNITLKNITVDKAVSDYRLEHGENIIFENVRVNGEKLPEKPEAKKD